MLDVLYNELLKKQLYPMNRTIDDVISSIFTLSKMQQEFAVALNSKLQEINMAVIKEISIFGIYWIEMAYCKYCKNTRDTQ